MNFMKKYKSFQYFEKSGNYMKFKFTDKKEEKQFVDYIIQKFGSSCLNIGYNAISMGCYRRLKDEN